MANIGIFYGTCGGTTKIVANALQEAFEIEDEDCINIEEDYDELEQFEKYDVLFLGSSTWGQGDLQHGWVDILLELSDSDINFFGKKVAFFGAGDSKKHSEHFCSALGKLYKAFKSKGATSIGFVDANEYTYKSSLALIDNKFCGLAIDEHNEANKTKDRIDKWIAHLKTEV